MAFAVANTLHKLGKEDGIWFMVSERLVYGSWSECHGGDALICLLGT